MAERDSVETYNNEEHRADNAESSAAKEKNEAPKGKDHINRRNTETKIGSVFSIILASVLAAVMLGAVVNSLDRQNTVYNQVSVKKAELERAQAENVRLQSLLDSKMSAKNVEDYAENVLGMRKIDSSQIKYIEIQTDDVVNIPQKDEGLLAKVKRFLNRCVEYFRG